MAKFETRRVVITGYGCYCSAGEDANSTYAAMQAGEQFIRYERPWLEAQTPEIYHPKLRSSLAARAADPNLLSDPAFAAQVDERYIERYLSRSAQLWWKASAEALRHARVVTQMLELSAVEPERFAFSIGTGIGGGTEIGDYRSEMEEGNALSATDMNRAQPENAEVTSAKLYTARGPGVTVTKACASSNFAISEAVRRIQGGEADVISAGGTEALDATVIAAFERTKAGSFDSDPALASRPFHREPGKAVLSEGAAVLILEDERFARTRGATIYGEVAGFGETNDAHDPTLLDGKGIVRAMKLALHRAKISPEDKLLLAAHATATPQGDIAERDAILEVFNSGHYSFDQIKRRVLSIKGFTGHPVGAATGVAAVMFTMALNEGRFFPASWLNDQDFLDKTEELSPSTDKVDEVEADAVLSNGMGFFGQNSSIVIKKYQEDA